MREERERGEERSVVEIPHDSLRISRWVRLAHSSPCIRVGAGRIRFSTQCERVAVALAPLLFAPSIRSKRLRPFVCVPIAAGPFPAVRTSIKRGVSIRPPVFPLLAGRSRVVWIILKPICWRLAGGMRTRSGTFCPVIIMNVSCSLCQPANVGGANKRVIDITRVASGMAHFKLLP